MRWNSSVIAWVRAAGRPAPVPPRAQRPSREPAANRMGSDEIAQLFGDDDEIIDELLEVFYDSLDPLKIKLTTAVTERAGNIKAVAHEIKGSAFNVGATFLASLAKKLEEVASQQDWRVIDALMLEIQNEIERAKRFVENRK